MLVEVDDQPAVAGVLVDVERPTRRAAPGLQVARCHRAQLTGRLVRLVEQSHGDDDAAPGDPHGLPQRAAAVRGVQLLQQVDGVDGVDRPVRQGQPAGVGP